MDIKQQHYCMWICVLIIGLRNCYLRHNYGINASKLLRRTPEDRVHTVTATHVYVMVESPIYEI